VKAISLIPANTLNCIGAGCYVQQALVCFRMLYYRFRFTVHCQNYRASCFLEMLHQSTGVTPKSSE